MSNARNLADIITGNFDVPLGALDNVPPSNDASALTTGTLPIARIADGAITAGKLASTLDLTGKTVTLPSGTGGKVIKVTEIYNSNTTVSFSGVGGTQLGSMDFYYPVNARIGGSFTKQLGSSESFMMFWGWYHTWASSNFHDTWLWIAGAESNGKHLGVDPFAQSGEDGPSPRGNYGFGFTVHHGGLSAGSHTVYLSSGTGDTRSHTGELNPNNGASRNPDTSNHSTFSQLYAMEIGI
jgi:uncharacterized protein (DUF779 family)